MRLVPRRVTLRSTRAPSSSLTRRMNSPHLRVPEEDWELTRNMPTSSSRMTSHSQFPPSPGPRRRYGFALDALDVDGDAALRERFGLLVPVVAVNGKVRFRGGVNAVLLERLLRAEAERRQSCPG